MFCFSTCFVVFQVTGFVTSLGFFRCSEHPFPCGTSLPSAYRSWRDRPHALSNQFTAATSSGYWLCQTTPRHRRGSNHPSPRSHPAPTRTLGIGFTRRALLQSYTHLHTLFHVGVHKHPCTRRAREWVRPFHHHPPSTSWPSWCSPTHLSSHRSFQKQAFVCFPCHPSL